MDGRSSAGGIVHDRFSRRKVLRLLGLEIGPALHSTAGSGYDASSNSCARLRRELFSKWAMARVGRFEWRSVGITGSTDGRDLFGRRARRDAALDSEGRWSGVPRWSSLLHGARDDGHWVPCGQAATAGRRAVSFDVRMEPRHRPRWPTAGALEQPCATSRHARRLHRIRERSRACVFATTDALALLLTRTPCRSRLRPHRCRAPSALACRPYRSEPLEVPAEVAMTEQVDRIFEESLLDRTHGVLCIDDVAIPTTMYSRPVSTCSSSVATARSPSTIRTFVWTRGGRLLHLNATWGVPDEMMWPRRLAYKSRAGLGFRSGRCAIDCRRSGATIWERVEATSPCARMTSSSEEDAHHAIQRNSQASRAAYQVACPQILRWVGSRRSAVHWQDCSRAASLLVLAVRQSSATLGPGYHSGTAGEQDV